MRPVGTSGGGRGETFFLYLGTRTCVTLHHWWWSDKKEGAAGSALGFHSLQAAACLLFQHAARAELLQ